MWQRSSASIERVRASLFFIPMLAVIAALALGGAALALDRSLDLEPGDLPLGVVSTVDAARALLSTIAGATISFAGIAFSVSLLIIQQASSQYSPRVVHTLFRDPFNKRVMGLVVGTFTYCVIVLRSVQSPLERGDQPVVPALSVALAVVLGIATILAIVAFIDHSAHSMDISKILESVRREATSHIQTQWRDSDPTVHDREVAAAPDVADARLSTIRFTRTGWVQQIDFDAVLRAMPSGSTLVVEAHPGRFAIAGTLMATLTPAPPDLEQLERAVNDAVSTGETRTMQQDASFALRQLADVAIKALSPGINDPTTAQDAIFHSAAVLAELLCREPPTPAVTVCEGRRLVAAQQPTHADLIRLAFAETRRAAADKPAVCVYLLEALELLVEPLEATGFAHRIDPLREQARLVVAGCRGAGLLEADLDSVEQAYQQRFGTPPA